MNAQDMFKDLGYKQVSNFNKALEYEAKHDIKATKCIYFNKENKIYITHLECMLTGDAPLFISKKEHQAIHQQMIELGWL